MKIKKSLKTSIYICLVILVFLSLVFLVNKCLDVCQLNYCSSGYSFSLALSIFITDLLYVLFAMLFWFVSPIGILFLLGIKLFFSEKASMLRRNFALLLQFLSFLSWSSLMFILLVVYIDSVSYRALNLGGDMLNLAIKSGFGFMIFMVMLAMAEKKIIFEQKHGLKKENGGRRSDKSNDKERNDSNLKKGEKEEKEKNDNKSKKIAGNEAGGIKGKIKRKIKEEIKEIIDDKIDRL